MHQIISPNLLITIEENSQVTNGLAVLTPLLFVFYACPCYVISQLSKGGFRISVILVVFFISFIFDFLYQAFRNHGTHVLLSLIPKEIIEDQMIHRSLKESQLSICSCRCSYNLSCHYQLLLHDDLSAPHLYFSSLKVKYHLCYLVSMADTKLMF